MQEMINEVALDNVEDELDYDFSISEIRIDSFEKFDSLLLQPYLKKDHRIYYRGERIVSLERPLIPTMFRDRSALIPEGEYHADITADYMLDLYRSYGEYYPLYEAVFENGNAHRIYDLCAFSQHYLDCSPFIDFTRSLYVALSFGLKDKTEFTDDGLMYTVEISDPAHYTCDPDTAEAWLRDYHVCVYNAPKDAPCLKEVRRSSPEARLIEIPNNDRMRFQQGAFLLLDKFNLVNRLYLTKNVRSSVRITKYILQKEICPELTALVRREAPWYSFANLLDISAGIRTAINCRRTEL